MYLCDIVLIMNYLFFCSKIDVWLGSSIEYIELLFKKERLE